ncbi:gluconate 2-dehydrogenase subunit 3 family protein [Haloplanus halophilus]|uniref:gluconate 2-dehydrogenase subunit 3 family protein n=1 Tax=Haloplanus halophilus TaxID=2949993 RepID=UPI00203A5262|nr:gluconate 2-dehydrogenase subunit 3 family protein [Haloplanus sp. GDY1]
MRLTRRDALAALAAAGVAVGGGAVLRSSDDERGGSGDDADRPVTDDELATLVAAAEVLYPSAVENVDAFVGRYVRGRAEDEPGHVAGVVDATGYLDEYAEAWYGEGFAALDRSDREEALRRMNVDTTDPDPEGSDVERVRYYVVNELLFALYASPTGGELVGIENPQGHPGGLASYQRGPQP